MRKALMSLILAATMVTPVAASAQTVREDRAQARAERQQQRQEARQQRQEVLPQALRPRARVEARQQVRADRREARIEARQQARIPAADWPGQRQRARAILNQQAREDGRQDLRQDRREIRQERREDRREIRQDRREVRQDRREIRRDARAWNRAWRQNARYDWQRYRYANRGLFNVGRYYAPGYGRGYGHGYSRFSIGFRIGSPFYSSRYWISDPWQYRLPPAYAGTRWVRYYDDVLLVDLYSGEVVDVIYDFFW